jgi:hypothetical protein
MILKVLFATALGIAMFALPAQASRPFIFTEDAVALPRGGAKLEVGLQHETWEAGHRVYALITEFSYSLYANLDLEIEVPYDVTGGGGTQFSDGIGDLWAKAKINFVKERAANPLTLSGLLAIKFPTGSTATGTNEVDVLVSALASKQFNSAVAHANLAYTFVGDDGVTDLNDVVAVSVAVAMDTPLKSVTGVGEIFWQEAPLPNMGDRLEIMGGAIRPLTPKLSVDGALRLGLTNGKPPSDGAPDYSLTAGLTYIYP